MPTLWPFPPSSISETLSFQTDVRRTRAGEFRDAIRDATQKLSYSYTLRDGDAGLVEAYFWSNAAGEWYVPLWHEATLETSAAYADVSLPVETDADYRAGGKAMIAEGLTKYELLNVDTIGSGAINLPSGEFVSQDYASPASIAPVLKGVAPLGLTRGAQYAVSTLGVEFTLIEPLDLAADNESDYNGYDLLDDPAAYVQQFSGGLRRALDFIETGFGSFAIETEEDYNRFRGTLSVAPKTYSDRWQLRQFLHRARGRERPFYLPTWKADLEIITAAGSGSNNLVIPAVTPTPADLVGRHVQIDAGGSIIRRQITGAAAGSGTITLTLNTTHGVTVGTDAVVSWLYLVRFDTDQLTLEHRRAAGGFVTFLSAPVVEVRA